MRWTNIALNGEIELLLWRRMFKLRYVNYVDTIQQYNKCIDLTMALKFMCPKNGSKKCIHTEFQSIRHSYINIQIIDCKPTHQETKQRKRTDVGFA